MLKDSAASWLQPTANPLEGSRIGSWPKTILTITYIGLNGVKDELSLETHFSA